MRRVFIIVLIIILVVIAAAFVLLRTGPGHELLKSIAANVLSSATGGDVRIARLSGALPGQVRLEGVSASLEGTEWLALDELDIELDAWALVSRRIDVDNLTIGRVKWTGDLPERKEENDAPPSSFALPDRLPDVAIRSFTLRSLVLDEGITGEPVELSAEGSLISGGEEIDLRLNANSSLDADEIAILIAHHTGEQTAFVDISIFSRAEGVISRLADLGGAVSVTAKGNAPLADFRLDLNAILGDLGSLQAIATADLEAGNGLQLAMTAQPGETLAAFQEELGPDVGLNARLISTENGGRIYLDELSTAAASMTGEAIWQNRGDRLVNFTFDLNTVMAADFYPALQEFTGDRLNAAAKLTPSGRFFDVEADLSSSRFEFVLRNARTDLRQRIEGDVDLQLAASDTGRPLLDAGASFAGRVSADTQQLIRVDDFKAVVAGSEVLRAIASFDPTTSQIAAEGDVTIAPDVAARLQSIGELQGAATSRFSLTGSTDNFALRLDGRTPALTFADGPVPAATFTANASGLPTTPQVEVSARNELSGRLRINAGLGQSGDVSIPELRMEGAGFLLTGSGRFTEANETGAIQIDYLGEDGAMPWPGLLLEGDASVSAIVNTTRGATEIGATINQLRIGDSAVSGLMFEANGSSQRLPLRFEVASLRLASAPALTKVSGRATANLAGRSLDIAQLSFLADGEPVALTAPMTIAATDGVSIKNLRGRYGEKGLIEADATIDPQRWRGVIRLADVALGATASTIDANANFDTSEEKLGAGQIVVTSEIGASPAVVLDANVEWTDSAVTIVSDDAEDRLSVDATLPIRLTRNERLGINTNGPLVGELAYQGRAEKVAALLPSAIQSLEGAITLAAQIGGTFAEPKVDGAFRLADGAYTELTSGLSIVGIDIEASATSDANGFDISYTLGASGPGQSSKTIRSDGRVSIGENSALKASLDLDRAQFTAGPVAAVIASGQLSVEGPLDAAIGEILASGEFVINQLDAEVETPETTGLVNIDVVAVNESGDPISDLDTSTPVPPVRLQIKVSAPDRIRIGGRGLESFWGADVAIEGKADEPLLLGALRMRRGSIDFAGRRFILTRGEILFDRLTPNNPVLDLRAEYTTGNGTVAAIVISGRAATPVVALQSTPALPQEDIMALVLFGKPATELTAFESLQMAQALAQLGGIGPFGGGGGTGAARRALGLDMLNLDLDPDSGTSSTLTVGKYVTDGLFVSATQDARGESGSVRVQYEINRNIVLETELKQSGDQTISANWKKDF